MEVTTISTIDISSIFSGGPGRTGMAPTQLIMLGLAIGGITIVMLSTYRKSRRSRQRSGEPVRDQYERLARQTTATRDVEKAMLELDRLARQILGRIDTRFAKLDVVIRDADERIAALSRLTIDSKSDRKVDVTLDQQLPENRSGTTDEPQSRKRHDVVYRLADDGLSSTDIARKIKKNKGEVELILALRETRKDIQRTESLSP